MAQAKRPKVNKIQFLHSQTIYQNCKQIFPCITSVGTKLCKFLFKKIVFDIFLKNYLDFHDIERIQKLHIKTVFSLVYIPI